MSNSSQQEETMDEVSELPPVANNIFAASREAPHRFELVGNHCDSCGRYSFPGSEHCSDCHTKTGQISLGSRGTIYSYTVVRTKPPLGLPQPYAVAYIDLEDVPLRIFCLLDPEQSAEVAIGSKVALSVGPLGVDNSGQACLRPFFQLLVDTTGI